MTDSPDISVVMSVYNGAEYLQETLDSILMQIGVSFELIIVNDGSTDQSANILPDFARRDGRVRVFQRENQGLTKSLITGCSQARGKYIARHDVGDTSLPDRLAKQLKCIITNADSALVSCGTRFVGPKGECLYDVSPEPTEATSRLRNLDLNEIRGPSHHGSTLFSKALYDSVGGYRSAFYFAQDLDLWVRLAERGTHVVMPEILYQASVTVSSLSGLYRKEQIETTRIILDAAKLRRYGLSEEPAVCRAERIRPVKRRASSRRARARALYFIGACLKRRNDPQARNYLREALRVYPLHLRSALRLLFG